MLDVPYSHADSPCCGLANGYHHQGVESLPNGFGNGHHASSSPEDEILHRRESNARASTRSKQQQEPILADNEDRYTFLPVK